MPDAPIKKLSAYVPVSCCVLTDSTGENHCTHPPRVIEPLPLSWRLRNRWTDLRLALAKWIAGSQWPDEDY